MAIQTSDLISVLSEKETLIGSLVLLLEEERKTVVEMDMANLEQVDDRKRQLLVQLEDSNNRFRQIMRRVAGEMNLSEGANLSSLLPQIDPPSRSELKRLQAKVLQLGGKLETALGYNRDLLQGSLCMVNRSLDFFGRIFKRSNTYGQAGSMVSSPADLRLVCKEI